MNHRFKILTYSLLAATLFTSPAAAAQQTVALRIGEHETYSRLVFDWPGPVAYELDRAADGTLQISFNQAATLDRSGASPVAGSGITGLRTISENDSNLAVQLDLQQGVDYRHFVIGSRVVIDVYYPEGAAPPQTAAQAAPQTQARSQPVPETTAAPPAPPVPDGPAVTGSPVAPVESGVLAAQRPLVDAHVINLTMTNTVGMAAFVRDGYLWIVLDRSENMVAPQIAGPHPELFGTVEKLEVKNGSAYRLKLPEGADFNLYGEGGGLVWRIVATPNRRDRTPVQMERTFLRNQAVRGGTAFWPLRQPSRVIELVDPAVGDVIKVVPVQQADQFTGAARRFVDFELLRAPIGLAVRPRVDNLDVSLTGSGVQVTRPGGLALTRDNELTRHQIRDNLTADEEERAALILQGDDEFRRLFDFDRWQMGGIQALPENQRIIMTGMLHKDQGGRVQDLLALAKMNIANDRGPEALGFLRFAEDDLPAIIDSAEFIALRGAANALAGKPEAAFADLFNPALSDYNEMDYWRAYTLAELEDWRQARQMMPKDFTLLVSYPRALLEKIGLKLAEVALRDGDVAMAEGILAVLQRERAMLRPWTLAGMDYLKGEAHRQSGEFTLTEKLWQPLSTGADDLYRVKAGLALTMLQLENGDIGLDVAIDRLEGMRYAWRGDELEAQVNFTLGRLYTEKGEHMKGFTILRDAASMSPESDVGRDIADYMTNRFSDLLLNDPDISALDAVTLYEEFRELTPTTAIGNQLVQKLAERLVEADLLTRAAGVLQHQVDFRLEGADKARVAKRLGVVYLLDRNARRAMTVLDTARQIYDQSLSGAERSARLREIDMLRARAFSQLNQSEEAIEILARMPPAPDVNRLRTDIAWQSGMWEDAAEGLQDMILDEALDLSRPLTPEQADLILNRAVALNLSGNRVALANMRSRYENAMRRSTRARLFEVVTRPRQTALLADRETIEAIVSEVDLFAAFLESYRKSDISN